MPPEDDLAIAFTDHYLKIDELRKLSGALSIVYSQELDPETRFYTFMYFVSRKWPKILEMDLDELEGCDLALIDSMYRTHLAHLEGQEDDVRQEPHWEEEAWSQATNDKYSAEEADWQGGLRPLLYEGTEVAKSIVSVMVDLGYGAVLQRFRHIIASWFHTPDWGRLEAAATEAAAEAAMYRRRVERYRQPVRNGWSGRTRRQAEYLGGTHVRLEEMARHCVELARHRSGSAPLIRLEEKRLNQELGMAYQQFVGIIDLVLHPMRIRRPE